MKKKDFEKWAETQPNFCISNCKGCDCEGRKHHGELRYFGFVFWGLIPECQKAPILEFKALQA